MRGYHPEDVDQFLEQMASAVEAMHDRLRQAVERAQRAEAVAAEAGNSDETLRRTLVLAQRTADMAVQEAREQASRIVASAEQQAQAIVGEAEDRARRLHGEALADVHAELAKLEAIRAQAQTEVDALALWATEHRSHLTSTLQEALAKVDRAGLITPAPSSSPIDVPFAAPRGNGPPPNGPLPTGPPRPPTGPSKALPPMAQPPPADESAAQREQRERQAMERDRDPGPPTEAVAVKSGPNTAAQDAPPADEDDERNPLTEPDETALDNFFEEGEFEDEPRFGGRLRRRH
jgi:cell division septum initiation protein DivIVA